MENEDCEYDCSDLIGSAQLNNQQLIVQQTRVPETTEEFLTRVLREDLQPKEYVRKRWVNIKRERQKLQKQLNKANHLISYWIAKRKSIVQELKKNSEEIERCRGIMLADCLGED